MINLKYQKNIEGKYGFYMNGGLVSPKYVEDFFNSLIFLKQELEQRLNEAEKVIDSLWEKEPDKSEMLDIIQHWMRSNEGEK